MKSWRVGEIEGIRTASCLGTVRMRIDRDRLAL